MTADHAADTPRRRTASERAAYLDGFEAGVEAALREVWRLNFSDAAERARPNIALMLSAVRDAS